MPRTGSIQRSSIERPDRALRSDALAPVGCCRLVPPGCGADAQSRRSSGADAHVLVGIASARVLGTCPTRANRAPHSECKGVRVFGAAGQDHLECAVGRTGGAVVRRVMAEVRQREAVAHARSSVIAHFGITSSFKPSPIVGSEEARRHRAGERGRPTGQARGTDRGCADSNATGEMPGRDLAQEVRREVEREVGDERVHRRAHDRVPQDLPAIIPLHLPREPENAPKGGTMWAVSPRTNIWRRHGWVRLGRPQRRSKLERCVGLSSLS